MNNLHKILPAVAEEMLIRNIRTKYSN